jgi:hypothetical protein
MRVLPQFPFVFMGPDIVFEMLVIFANGISHLVTIQQGDSTIDELYTQSSTIWRQLDFLLYCLWYLPMLLECEVRPRVSACL